MKLTFDLTDAEADGLLQILTRAEVVETGPTRELASMLWLKACATVGDARQHLAPPQRYSGWTGGLSGHDLVARFRARPSSQVFVSIPGMDMDQCLVTGVEFFRDEENDEAWIQFKGREFLEDNPIGERS